MGRHPAISQVFWSGAVMMKYLCSFFFFFFVYFLFFAYPLRRWLILIRIPTCFFLRFSSFSFLYSFYSSQHTTYTVGTVLLYGECEELKEGDDDQGTGIPRRDSIRPGLTWDRLQMEYIQYYIVSVFSY